MPRDPIHPGQFLADELAELEMTPADLARELHVPAHRIYQILNGRRAMTGPTPEPVVWHIRGALAESAKSSTSFGSPSSNPARKSVAPSGVANRQLRNSSRVASHTLALYTEHLEASFAGAQPPDEESVRRPYCGDPTQVP